MTSLSVIIATYNRAAILKETLEAMTQVDRTALDVQWIVVDNNSTDDTAAVLESFSCRLPLKCLFEPKPGKNNALNTVLRSAVLQDIVVFTDDDISPASDWLIQIARACERYSDISVFGGRIALRWPSAPPRWLVSSWMRSFGFSEHDFGPVDRPYAPGCYPFGGNFWLRRELFESGRTFRAEMGPMKDKRIMGSETSFLRPLAEEGEKMVYCPEVVVEHRIKTSDGHFRTLRKRAYSLGRGIAQMSGLHHKHLYIERPRLWHLRQALKALIGTSKLAWAYCRPTQAGRIEAVCRAYAYLGHLVETYNLTKKAAERHSSALLTKRPAIKL